MRVRYAFLAALLFAGFGCGAQPPATKASDEVNDGAGA